MASLGMRLLPLTLICNIIAGTSDIVQLKCNGNNIGRFGQQSLLECIVILSKEVPDVQIEWIIWKRNEAKTALIDYKSGSTPKYDPRFTLAEPPNVRLNVSMLVNNTLMADRGNYTCLVNTDRGFCTSSAPRLCLSVPYSTPSINCISRNPNQKVAMTLSCNATGGYPEGKILWFDEYGTDWSPSSQQDAIETTDGRFNLVSKLDLLSGSSFSKYKCAVHNTRGEREGESQYIASDPDPPVRHEEKTPKSDLASKIVVPLVIIGSLIIGLLIVRLLKPHCQSSHQALSTNNEYGYEDELQTKTKPEGEYSSCVTPQSSNVCSV